MSEPVKNISQSEYQEFCDTTDHYPEIFPGGEMIFYAAGYGGESGEVSNKIKKIFRDDSCILTPERREMIIKEMGGAYWYFSRICKALNITPDEIRQANYEELFSRRERGTVLGDGDNR